MEGNAQGLLQELVQALDRVIQDVYRCTELLHEVTKVVEECHKAIDGPTSEQSEHLDMPKLWPHVEGAS